MGKTNKGKNNHQSTSINSDLIEFIYSDGRNHIITEIISRPTMDKLPRLIQLTLGDHGKQSSSVLFLDLHGVVDTVDPTIRLSDWPICVISFVGRSSRTREVAHDDIAQRINSGQIHCGCLVFQRPKYSGVEIPEERLIGSKAWIINEYCSVIPFDQCVFVDDGEDHVQIVQSHCTKKDTNGNLIDCYLYGSTESDLPTYLSFATGAQGATGYEGYVGSTGAQG